MTPPEWYEEGGDEADDATGGVVASAGRSSAATAVDPASKRETLLPAPNKNLAAIAAHYAQTRMLLENALNVEPLHHVHARQRAYEAEWAELTALYGEKSPTGAGWEEARHALRDLYATEHRDRIREAWERDTESYPVRHAVWKVEREAYEARLADTVAAWKAWRGAAAAMEVHPEAPDPGPEPDVAGTMGPAPVEPDKPGAWKEPTAAELDRLANADPRYQLALKKAAADRIRAKVVQLRMRECEQIVNRDQALLRRTGGPNSPTGE